MRVLLLSVVLAIAGCDAVGDGDVTLLTDREAYAPEATARVQLANETNTPVHYSDLDCVALQARTAAGWAEAQRAVPACKDVLYELSSGAAQVAEVALSGVPAGTYRFQTVVVVDGIQEALATAPFDVDASLAGSP